MKHALAMLFVIICWFPVGASAATFRVNVTADAHDYVAGDGLCGPPLGFAAAPIDYCTLRAAIEEASALPGPDTVLIDATVTAYVLLLGALEISDNGTVVTTTADPVIIDGTLNEYASDVLVVTSDSNDISFVTVRNAGGHGIRVEGAYNRIGGSDTDRPTRVVGCGRQDQAAFGILITGNGAHHNIVRATFVGVDGNSTIEAGNASGLGMLMGSSHNHIGGPFAGRNVISGNTADGIVIGSGSFGNTVDGNIIGPDITGSQGPGNGGAGIRITDRAVHNSVGTADAGYRNLISLNSKAGIIISGEGTDSNVVSGNYIGCDFSSDLPLGNRIGVWIDNGARFTRVGGTDSTARNIISGNLGDGIRISGSATSDHAIIGNFIGTERFGIGRVGNGRGFDGGSGVHITDGAHANRIGGGEADRNVICNNFLAGVTIEGRGTRRNKVVGNYIGVNVYGASSLSNATGVVIRDGADYNDVGGTVDSEGNVISSNRGAPFPYGAGVVVLGPQADHNRIRGNRIGTDATGTRNRYNSTAGIIVGHGAVGTVIGGSLPAERNTISANGEESEMTANRAAGIHIFGYGTDSTQILNNFIGTSADGEDPLPNAGHGVGIFGGARFTMIGGGSDQGNLIAFNAANGIVVDGGATYGHTIRFNQFRDNDSLAIALWNGANADLGPPRIVLSTPTATTVQPDLNGGYIDLYISDGAEGAPGEGSAVIGSTMFTGSGAVVVPTSNVAPGDVVAALLTDSDGNTSEFSVNAIVDAATNVDALPGELPSHVSLSPAYPNPFNPATTVEFTLPRREQVRITVFNILGRQIRALVDESRPAGRYRVFWEGDSDNGALAGTGVYFIRMETDDETLHRKVIMLK